MSRIIKFPNGEERDESKAERIKVKREFCDICSAGLDLWTDDTGVAYGLCDLCDLGVGSQPIELVSNWEE
jgi:hypothetical protein